MPGPEGGVVGSAPGVDSDGDIEDTHAADLASRAVRIIRSPVSYNERPFLPGKFGEEILANSAD
jgi:acid phosphatase class B